MRELQSGSRSILAILTPDFITLRGFITLACIGLLLVAPIPATAQAIGGHEALHDLEVVSAETGRHAFSVEFADTRAERARGLMYRERLAPRHGMLFDFGHARQVSMWMKNTLIPLDMLFIAPDGRIVAIHRNAVPGSLAPIGPAKPVRAVLEVNAGVTRDLDIRPGDVVLHPIFERILR